MIARTQPADGAVSVSCGAVRFGSVIVCLVVCPLESVTGAESVREAWSQLCAPAVSCSAACKKLLTMRKVVEVYQEIDKSQVAGVGEGWTSAPGQIHRRGVFVRQSNPGAVSSPQTWRWRVPLVKSLTGLGEGPLVPLRARAAAPGCSLMRITYRKSRQTTLGHRRSGPDPAQSHIE